MRNVGYVNFSLAVAWPLVALVTTALALRFTFEIIVLVKDFEDRASALRQPSNSSTHIAEPSTPGSHGSSVSSPNANIHTASPDSPRTRARTTSRSNPSHSMKIGLYITVISAVCFSFAIVMKLMVSIVFCLFVFTKPPKKVSDTDTRWIYTRGWSRFPFLLSNLAQAGGIVSLLIVCFERCRSTFARTQYRITQTTVRCFYGVIIFGTLNICIAITLASLSYTKEGSILASLSLIFFPATSIYIVWKFQSSTWHISRRMMSMVTLTKPPSSTMSPGTESNGGITPTPVQSSRVSINVIAPPTENVSNNNSNCSTTVSPGVTEIEPARLTLAKSVSGTIVPKTNQMNATTPDSGMSAGSSKTFTPPTAISLPRSPTPEVRKRASSNRRSLYRISSLMETSLRLTIVGTAAIISTMVMLAVTIVNLNAGDTYLSIAEVMISHGDLCLNAFSLLCMFREYEHWYIGVFGALHDCLFKRLKF